MININEQSIVVKEGMQVGNTVAIFAGIHGNETVGILALQKAIEEIELMEGKVFFVFANPPAIAKDVREINKNLNRLFVKDSLLLVEGYEASRAKELMEILDQSDALLDLHASNSLVTQPFIICEKRSFDLAKKLDFDTVTLCWGDFQKGSSDLYMEEQRKPALCLECGSIFEPQKNLELAFDSIVLFLQHFGLLKEVRKYHQNTQKYIKITEMVLKGSKDFSFTKDFNDFDKLVEGEVFARDGENSYIAKANQYIIFPRPNKPVGGEVFLLGEEIAI
jgi:succinylglutamate desuccinylase